MDGVSPYSKAFRRGVGAATMGAERVVRNEPSNLHDPPERLSVGL
jgi:hypothetical protein